MLNLESYFLDNGLRVVLNEDHSAPLVAVNLWYHVGSKNERPGRTGFAHLFEHMLFSGSKHVGNNEHFRHIQSVGGVLNGTTFFDRTNYFETLPSSEIDLALAIESDRIYDTRIEPDEAEAERTVVISEREGSENYPEFWLREEVQSVAWREHPYRLGVIGPKSNLRAMTREDLYRHYKRYYMTNNATMVIAGDFVAAEVLDKIHKEFDKHPAGTPPQPLGIEEMPQTGERRVLVRRRQHGVSRRSGARAVRGSRRASGPRVERSFRLARRCRHAGTVQALPPRRSRRSGA